MCHCFTVLECGIERQTHEDSDKRTESDRPIFRQLSSDESGWTKDSWRKVKTGRFIDRVLKFENLFIVTKLTSFLNLRVMDGKNRINLGDVHSLSQRSQYASVKKSNKTIGRIVQR